MDCQGARFGFGNLQPLHQNGFRRTGAVGEIEVIVTEASIDKTLAVVNLLVEPHNCCDVFPLVVVPIVLGSVESVARDLIAPGGRPAEGHELPRHDPVEVSILHLLIVLVLIDAP